MALGIDMHVLGKGKETRFYHFTSSMDQLSLFEGRYKHENFPGNIIKYLIHMVQLKITLLKFSQEIAESIIAQLSGFMSY